MSSKTSGSFSTLLLSLPLAGVALMAIFGVPQFAPVVASPDDEEVVRSPGSNGDLRGRPDDFFQEVPTVQYGDDAPMFDADARQVPAALYGGARPQDGNLSHSRQQGGAWDDRAQAYSSPPENWNDPPEPTWPTAATAAMSSPRKMTRPQLTEQPNAWTLNAPTMIAQSAIGQRPERLTQAEGSSAQLGWREASLRLTELGIDNYHLERGQTEGTFLFVCLFSQASSPNVVHRFEAESSEPLLAVNRVLQQIDDWLTTRFAHRSPAPYQTGSL